jgi:hypothetical protein
VWNKNYYDWKESEGNSEGRVEEEGTTRPSPTASVLEAYHVVPPPSTSRNLLARTRMFAKASARIHTSNRVIVLAISCSFSQSTNASGIGPQLRIAGRKPGGCGQLD